MNDWVNTIKKTFSYHSSELTEACTLDLDSISQQLQLEEKAQEAAEKELPIQGAVTPDGVEREIQSYFIHKMANINHIVNEGLCVRNTSITETHLQDERALMNNHTEHSKLAVKSLIAREFRLLRQLKQELGGIQQEFQSFQSSHHLQRTADYPDSQILYFSVILLFWLLESSGNGYFFAEGSDLGLLGGVGQAIIIAAINISIAFFLVGWGCRYKNHYSIGKRTVAYLGGAIYLPCVFGFNLLVAHYRDFFALNPDNASNLAVQHFIQAPWELAEFNSWILFLMGLLFAVFALIDGYKRDDIYPGYGKLHRRLQQVHEDYDEHRDDIVMEIEDIRQEFLIKLEDMKQAVLLKHTRLVHLVEEKQVFVAEYKQGVVNCVAASNALVYRYRDTNRRYRQTPAPTYFEDDWKSNHELMLRGAQDDIAVVDKQKQLFNDFPQYCQQRANEIEKLYVSFFQQLQSIDPDIQWEKTEDKIVLSHV